LLKHLLSQAGDRRWAVVVNDLATLNIDAALVRDAAETGRKVVDLGNGCVCCSNRDELGETLAELSATGDYDHILVETTGVAEPRGVAALFTQKNPFGRSLSDFARLSSLVSVVDAAHFLREWREYEVSGRRAFPGTGQRPVFELMLEQVECADVIVLGKRDLVSADAFEELEGIVRGLNPRAEMIAVEHGRVEAEWLLTRARFHPQETLKAASWLGALERLSPAGREAKAPRSWIVNTAPAADAALPEHERRFGLKSIVYQRRRPFSEEKLRAFLLTEGQGILRAKGFFWTRERPDEMGFLSIAGGVVRLDYLSYWWAALIENGKATLAARPTAIIGLWQDPAGDRRQEMVFIGKDLKEKTLYAQLDACLDTSDN